MFDSYFTIHQQITLGIIFLFLSITVLAYDYFNKPKTAIAFFILCVFTLKYFFAGAEIFLNVWDEQFHALVAKNLSKRPLVPLLYPQALLPYDYKGWSLNFVWLHKQPLFLWQMALSLKLLGTSAFAVRLPSLILSATTAFLVYKIGKNFFNSRIGFYGALLYAFNHYYNELLSGFYPTDQNDVSFIFYVTASLWAFSEHLRQPNQFKWILLTGLFAGGAVLCKWLTGLLVYSGWGVYIIIQSKSSGFKIKDYYPLLKAALVSVAVFLPWQIYILNAFPREAAHEYQYNSRHFVEAIEGHGGDMLFHLDNLSVTLGKLSVFFILPGFIYLRNFARKKVYFIISLFYVLVVFIFFTLAKTKMPAFTFIVHSFIFLGFGAIFTALHEYLRNYKRIIQVLVSLLFVLTCILFLRIEDVQENHTSWHKNMMLKNYRKIRTEGLSIYNQINQLNLDTNTVIFNCRGFEEVPLMFHTNYIGYWGFPEKKHWHHMKKFKKKVAILDFGYIPDNLRSNPEIKIITPKEYRIDHFFKAHIKISQGYLSINGDTLSIESSPNTIFLLSNFGNGTWQITDMRGRFIKQDETKHHSIYAGEHKETFDERFWLQPVKPGLFKLLTDEQKTIKWRKQNMDEVLIEILPLNN